MHSYETAELKFEFRFSDSISISINFNRLLLKVYHVAGIVLCARGTKIGGAAAGLAKLADLDIKAQSVF